MKKYLVYITLFTLVFTGCKKAFLDLNENPNFPSTVPARSLISSAQFRTAASLVSNNLQLPASWMGFIAYSPNYAIPSDSRNYVLFNTTVQSNNYFTTLYSIGYDWSKVASFAQKDVDNFSVGIGKAMLSMIMQNTVDIYGNVPYSEAFKETANQTPKYDDGKQTYESLYDVLGVAISKFKQAKAAGDVFPTSSEDLMYGGRADQDKLWIKFANTMRLRLLIRQSLKTDRAAYIAGKLAKDFPEGLASFIQAGDGAVINPGYANSSNQQNPFYANYGFTPSGTASNPSLNAGKYAVDFYKNQNDPRISYFYAPLSNGTYNGNDIGTQGTSTPGYSPLVNKFTRNATDPAAILTDFESLFLQAEAIERGWFSGATSKSKFEDAQIQSFIYTSGSAAGINTLTPTADNNWNLATDKIKLIITQKWASLNTINYLEPWTEYRRTGFPTVTLSLSPTLGANHIPYKYPYPQTEISVNAANIPTVGNNAQTDKIWWML